MSASSLFIVFNYQACLWPHNLWNYVCVDLRLCVMAIYSVINAEWHKYSSKDYLVLLYQGATKGTVTVCWDPMWCFLEKPWTLISWPRWKNRWKSVISVWWWVILIFTCIHVIFSSCVILLRKNQYLFTISQGLDPIYNGVQWISSWRQCHCSMLLTYRWARLQSFTQQPCLGPRLHPGASQWRNSIQKQHQKLSTSRKSVKKLSACWKR